MSLCDCSSHSISTFSRRNMLAGSLGMMGLGTLGLSSPNTVAASSSLARPQQVKPKKSVIFIWMTGGLSQHDSFDMKPDAPESVRGEFDPIDTKTPGIQICEHLPMLAQRSHHWSLVRSMKTDSSGHGPACHMLLTGRQDLPPTFNSVPSPNDWPSIASQVTYAVKGRNSLPSAIVLPQPSINEAAKVRPGQFAARLGTKWEAWHVNVAAKCPLGNGACPECFRFDDDSFEHAADTIFDTPFLTLPEGGKVRLDSRLDLLASVEQSRNDLNRMADVRKLGTMREQAVTVLADPRTRQAFDVENADPELVARYGKNKFGLSVLMAKLFSEADVPYVQVNLGKNSSWDTHRRNFVNLKRNLLPHLDRAMSALLDDLAESGRLDDTLVILTGEFGRTPKINKNSGRDHWGPLNSVFFAGGGVQGGRVIGRSDDLAAYPVDDVQTPETLAATMFHTLGIPYGAQYLDVDDEPQEIYRGNPILSLM